MKAVYTLHLKNEGHYGAMFCGFTTAEDLSNFLTLSVHYSKKQFSSVELFGDAEGIEFAKRYKIPFTEFTILELPEGINKGFWSYTKIQTYAAQTEPFIHIDCDVILWESLTPEQLKAPILFQNIEEFNVHSGYGIAYEYIYQNHTGMKNYVYPKFAYNCGVVMVNDLKLVAQWKKEVDYFLFSDDSSSFWANYKGVGGISWNHVIEQGFIASVCAKNNVSAHLLIPGFIYENIVTPTFKITHLWGNSKQRPDLMLRIKNRLAAEYPEAENLSHAEIFSNIYKTNAWTYGSGAGSLPAESLPFRKWLAKFVKDNKVKSITDLGCGDMQVFSLVNLKGINYTGIDCVPFLQETNKLNHPELSFVTADVKTAKFEQTDLLLLKDVLIHWTNKEIKKFFARKLQAKYIVIVGDTNTTGTNEDIENPGSFHPIDITKPPFNIKAKKIAEYLNKTIYIYQPK